MVETGELLRVKLQCVQSFRNINNRDAIESFHGHRYKQNYYSSEVCVSQNDC